MAELRIAFARLRAIKKEVYARAIKQHFAAASSQQSFEGDLQLSETSEINRCIFEMGVGGKVNNGLVYLGQ
jgi:hypothetical protein